MIYDVTGKTPGENFPYSDGCVMVFRTENGNVTVNFDPNISRGEAARVLEILAEGLSSAESAAGAADFPGDLRPAQSSSVKPEDVTEDFVRWRDGYLAYKQNGSWWWIRWRDGEDERWGMSGPLMGAIEYKKGPYDNFDETLASMMRHRAEVFRKNSYIG